MTTTPPRSPVPQEVSAELRRVTERWRTMTPAQTDAAAPLVHALVADLARGTGLEVAVPHLGPEVLPDQLAVVVHDACAEGLPEVLERLTRLRRDLSRSLRREP